MKKLRIMFPQIVIESKEVEVTEEKFDELLEHSSCEEKADFIWSNMTSQEQSWTNGKKWVESAIESDYALIVEPSKPKP